jgi:hypothetical protein
MVLLRCLGSFICVSGKKKVKKMSLNKNNINLVFLTTTIAKIQGKLDNASS